MITKRLAGSMIAGSLAIGLALGAASTIVAKDSTSGVAAACADYMSGANGMMSGANGMMSGQDGVGPDASAVPDQMPQHHPTTSPVPGR